MAMRPHVFGIDASNPHIGPNTTDILRATGHHNSGGKQKPGRLALQWDICPRCAWPGEKDTYQTNDKVPNKTRPSGSCSTDNLDQCRSMTTHHYTEKAKRQMKASLGVHRNCIRSVKASYEDQALDTKPVRLQAVPSIPLSVQHDQHRSGVFQQSSTSSCLNGSDVTQLHGAEDKKHTSEDVHWQRRENSRTSWKGPETSSGESAASTSNRVKRTRRQKETKHGCSVPILPSDSADSPARVSQLNSRSYKDDKRRYNEEGGMTRLASEKPMVVSDFTTPRESPSASLSQKSMTPCGQYGIQLESQEVNAEEQFLLSEGYSGAKTHSEHSKEKLQDTSCAEVVESEHDDLMSSSDTLVPPHDSEEALAGTRDRNRDKAWKADKEVARCLTSSPFPDAKSQQTLVVETEVTVNEGLSRCHQQEESRDEEESSADGWKLCLQRKQRNVCGKIKDVHLHDVGERTTIVGSKIGKDNKRFSLEMVLSGRSSLSESDEPSSSSDDCRLGNKELMEMPLQVEKSLFENAHPVEEEYVKNGKNVLNISGRSAARLGRNGEVEKREAKVYAKLVTKEEGEETELNLEEMEGKKHTRKGEDSEEEDETMKEEPEKIALSGKKEEEEEENEEKEVVMELEEAKGVLLVKAGSDDDKVDMEKGRNSDLNQEECEEESEDNSDGVELLIVKEVEQKAEDSAEEDGESADSEEEEDMANGERGFIVNTVFNLEEEGHSPPLKYERCQSSDERESENSSDIHVDKDLSEGEKESCLGPRKEELGCSEEEGRGSEDSDPDEEEDEGTEEAKSKRDSESGSEMTTTSYNAPVPERNAEDDSEQEDIKETKEKEEAEFNLISSGSPTRERKSWLQRFGCLTSCLFPGKCRKRAALRRSSQDSLHTLPELHPVETTLELAAVADYQSQKSMQGDERCRSGSPPQKSYLQDKMESGIPVGTKDFIEGSEASSTESEDVTEKGRSLEKEDFDGFYD
ncbi:glutamic acid-rich protein-like isoform X1 [Pleurodeles waltl]|uniref:glutamic acid-rich protein-like isoform X1 n=1 Tax=Pleurodeles waltl TaxID=8319 RepID=UPI0037097EE3